jgi:hypothetical protein
MSRLKVLGVFGLAWKVLGSSDKASLFSYIDFVCFKEKSLKNALIFIIWWEISKLKIYFSGII